MADIDLTLESVMRLHSPSPKDSVKYDNCVTSLSCIFGYMVYKSRQNSTHTQVEFARQFGISHTALIKIEKGFTSISLDFLQEFSLITNNTLSSLQLLAEDIIIDLLSKKVDIVSSSKSQAICNKLVKLHGNKFYEKEVLEIGSSSAPNVLLLDSLGRAIDPKLLTKIFKLVVLDDKSTNDPRAQKLINDLKSQKMMESYL